MKPSAFLVNIARGAVIDGRGKIVKSLPWRTAGVIDASLPAAANSPPPFARIGNAIPIALGFLLMIGGIVLGRRPRYRRHIKLSLYP